MIVPRTRELAASVWCWVDISVQWNELLSHFSSNDLKILPIKFFCYAPNILCARAGFWYWITGCIKKNIFFHSPPSFLVSSSGHRCLDVFGLLSELASVCFVRWRWWKEHQRHKRVSLGKFSILPAEEICEVPGSVKMLELRSVVNLNRFYGGAVM